MKFITSTKSSSGIISFVYKGKEEILKHFQDSKLNNYAQGWGGQMTQMTMTMQTTNEV